MISPIVTSPPTDLRNCRYNVEILSLDKAHLIPDKDCAIIYISTPGETPKTDKFGKNNVVLELSFYDVTKELESEVMYNITTEQVDALINFIETYVSGKTTKIFCVCEYGLARSPAIAAGLCYMLGESNSKIFQLYNMLNKETFARLMSRIKIGWGAYR